MERRMSSRLKKKIDCETEPAFLSRKRKSESPESKIKPKIFKANSQVTDKISVTINAPSKLAGNFNVTSNTNVNISTKIDKARHDSIEKCVADTANNINLSSDSESENSSDEVENETPINSSIQKSAGVSSQNKTVEDSESIESTSEYFDFTQILSNQNTYETLLLTQSKASEGKSFGDNENLVENECVSDQRDNSAKENIKRPSKTKNTIKGTSKLDKGKILNSTTTKRSPKQNCKNVKNIKQKIDDEKVKNSFRDKTKNLKKEEDLNVKDLLALGEGVDTSQLKNLEEADYENDEYEIPEQVEITLDLPNNIKKKKSGVDLEAALKRRLNSVKKENQVFVHKVHLLCLISHGFNLNKVLNSENLIAVALSIIPSKHCYPPKHVDISYLEEFMSWFHKKITIENNSTIFNVNITKISDQLIQEFSEQKALNKIDFILMFIVIMRSLGLKCRLLINLQPNPLKLSADHLLQVSTKPKNESSSKCKDENDSKKSAKQSDIQRKPRKELQKNPRFENKISKKEKEKLSKYFESSSTSSSKSKYFQENLKGSPIKNKLSLKSKPSCSKSEPIDDMIISGSSDESDDSYYFDFNKKAKKTLNKKSPKKSSLSGKSSSNRSKSSTSKSPKIDRRVLSTDTDTDHENQPKSKCKKKGIDVWCELFLEAEEKWICVDILNRKYHCVERLYASATHPVAYVLAWNNNNTIKDLTKRYAPQWLTLTQKLRVEPDWWSKTLRPYRPQKSVWEEEEDEEMERQLKDQPLPVSLAEYKNHPLYVLPKDLHKFQAIYPSNIAPVGHFRGEKVYPRSAVVELHTRETWLKEARLVRLGETPFKVVKARMKKDKFGFLPTEEKKSELFGFWQTEDYIPPVAQNGVVPRNSFGNVDFYMECMLPKGTVHLQLPQLQRIARKLNIDCAPAMVGFEPCRFGSRPVMDGWIVCEEFKDVLLDAWNQEYDEKTKQENEKRRKRAKANWRKLLRCLRVKKRLQARYFFNLESAEESSSSKDTC